VTCTFILPRTLADPLSQSTRTRGREEVSANPSAWVREVLHGRSSLSISMALAVVTGTPWLGPLVRRLPVLSGAKEGTRCVVREFRNSANTKDACAGSTALPGQWPVRNGCVP
jgi:hypothetical protein